MLLVECIGRAYLGVGGVSETSVKCVKGAEEERSWQAVVTGELHGTRIIHSESESQFSVALIAIIWTVYLVRALSGYMHQPKRIKISHIFMMLLLMFMLCGSSVGAAVFTQETVVQDNPLSSRSKTITVTLETDSSLAATNGSVVTISGLKNALASSPIILLDERNNGETIFSDGMTQGQVVWNYGTLTLTVHTGLTLAAGTTYTFSFTLTNPLSSQSAQAVVIKASGTSSFSVFILLHVKQLYGHPTPKQFAQLLREYFQVDLLCHRR